MLCFWLHLIYISITLLPSSVTYSVHSAIFVIYFCLLHYTSQFAHTTVHRVSSTYHYFTLVSKQSIAIRVSACLSICLSVCPLTYLDNHKSKFHKILCTSPVAMARSYDGTTTRYVLRFVDGVTPIGQNQRQCYVSSSSLAAPFRCQTMLH